MTRGPRLFALATGLTVDRSTIDGEDVDPTEDAEAFPVWTSTGCPAG
jgi:hypothetical protein